MLLISQECEEHEVSSVAEGSWKHHSQRDQEKLQNKAEHSPW